jgi:DNA repair protein RadD
MKTRWYQEEAVTAMLNCEDNGVVVLPTGSGKTLVMREFVKRANQRIVLLSHVKEILTQNFESMASLGNVGLYSSGLNMQMIERTTIAGIQSVYNKPHIFSGYGGCDKVLIDECHLVNDVGMYKQFLDAIGVPYIGLTATPYRLKQGYIYGKDGMFDRKIYEAPIGQLQDEGHLTRLVMKGSAKNEMNTDGLALTGGDFNLKDASLRFNRAAITEKIIDELIKYKQNYKHWLLFAIDIEHAEQVAECLNNRGITAEAVHSKSPRDETLLRFKSGAIQAVVNVNILTTGFDFPAIDLIAMLRPTKSPTLHVQALGRGLRKADGKRHCLIKDFAGNIGRLGFIDDIQIDPEKKKGKGGVNPFAKTCPECETVCHPSVRKCDCGYEFKFLHHLSTSSFVPPEWYDVTGIFYNIHQKTGKPDSLKISYRCGVKSFTDYIMLQHGGYAGYKSKYKVQMRWPYSDKLPATTAELYAERGRLRVPKRIQVEHASKYPKILKTQW